MARPASGQVITRRRQRGTVYALRFYAYGKRRFVTLPDGCSLTRAEEELANVLADVRRGVWRPDERQEPEEPRAHPTFHEFASEWFESRRQEGLKQTTLDAIAWRLTYVLLPHFKDHRLSDISVQEVDRYRQAQVRDRDRLIELREAQAELPREEREQLSRPLANSTINRTIALLAQILEVAVEYGMIETNPAAGKRRKLKTRKPRRSYLDSAAQITSLLDAAEKLDREARAGRQHVGRRALLATLVFSGARLSELLALTWPDVDLAGGWISIPSSKTDAGVRKIKLRPVLRDLLAARKASVPRAAWSGYVFATSSGAQHSPSNVRRMMRAVWQRANQRLEATGEPPLPTITPHSLRRTWASLMFALGEPIPSVMADGGWADPQVPLGIYAHAMRRDAGETQRLRELVEGASHHPAPVDDRAEVGHG
jgi:integrase